MLSSQILVTTSTILAGVVEDCSSRAIFSNQVITFTILAKAIKDRFILNRSSQIITSPIIVKAIEGRFISNRPSQIQARDSFLILKPPLLKASSS